MNKFIFIIVKILLAMILCWILVKNSLLNIKILTFIFRSPLVLLYLFFLMVFNVSLSAYRWYKLNLIQQFGISYRDTFWATYIGLTFNSLLPGSVGGDLVRINYLFKRLPQKKMAGALSVLADRVIGLLGVFFSLCFIGILAKKLFGSSKYLSLYMSLGIWISFLAIAFVLLFLLVRRLGAFEWAKKRFISGKIAQLGMIIRIYKKSPWVVVECIGVSIIIQMLLGYIAATTAYLLQFNSIELIHYIIASLVTQLASLIPLSPGGLGIGEMAFAKTIIQLNPNMPAAYASIYLAYRIIYMLFSAPGIFIFLKMNVKKAENSLKIA